MKKLVLIMVVMAVGGLALIGYLIFKGVSGIGAGCIATADSFMVAARDGKYADAMTFLSETYRSASSESDVRQFMAASLLDKYGDATWNSRRIENSRGWLEGTVETTTGGKVPVKMEFINEAAGWRIVSIMTPNGTSPPGGALAGKAIPATDQQVELVRRSFRDFTASLKRKTLASFHSTLSRPFAEQFPVEKLDSVYAAFFGVNVDWGVLDTTQPTFTSAASIDTDGVLLLEGFFPTTPDKVSFRQKYIREGGDWKLLGFNVNIGQ